MITAIIALAMNTGFRETLQDRLLGVTAHISLTKPGASGEGIHDYRALMDHLAKTPGVRSVTPAIYETLLLSFGGRAQGVVTKGIDVEREVRSDEALQKLSAGSLNFAPDAEGIDGLLVSASDIDSLTEALARLMDNRALCERLGRGGRQRVLDHYNLQRNVEKLAAIFAERVRP